MNEKELNLAIRNNIVPPIPKFSVTDIDSRQMGNDVALFWEEKGARLFIDVVSLVKFIALDKSSKYSAKANQILETYRDIECEEDEI